MAISQSIRDALDSFIDHQLELEYFVKSVDEAIDHELGSEQPAWIFVAGRQIERLRQSAHVLEALLRQQALPRLEDMEAIHKKTAT